MEKTYLEELASNEDAFSEFIKKVESILTFKIGVVEKREVEWINKLGCYRLDFAFSNDHFSVCDPRFDGKNSVYKLRELLPENITPYLYDNGTLSLMTKTKGKSK